jgi:hypothetical protein
LIIPLLVAVLKLAMTIIVRKNAIRISHSMDEVQMMRDHARRESVKRYASVQLEAKRRLLEGKL